MSWFNCEEKNSENILFSKYTYTRNISGMFPSEQTPDKIIDVILHAETLLKKNGFAVQRLTEKDNTQAKALFEQQYTDFDFCGIHSNRAVFFNEPCNLCISVGGTNLINISAVLPGASIKEAYNISLSAEKLLDGEFDFAYSEEFGYLSPIPASCGNGIKMSSALYLPLLSRYDKINSLFSSLSAHGIFLYPAFPSNCESDVYIITYSPPYGTDGEYSARVFEHVVSDIVSLEKSELENIDKPQLKNISEKASRSLGALLYSNRLSESDLIRSLSEIRLAVSVGENKNLPQTITPGKLCEVLYTSLSCCIVSNSKSPITNNEELDIARSINVKKLLNATKST